MNVRMKALLATALLPCGVSAASEYGPHLWHVEIPNFVALQETTEEINHFANEIELQNCSIKEKRIIYTISSFLATAIVFSNTSSQSQLADCNKRLALINKLTRLVDICIEITRQNERFNSFSETVQQVGPNPLLTWLLPEGELSDERQYDQNHVFDQLSERRRKLEREVALTRSKMTEITNLNKQICAYLRTGISLCNEHFVPLTEQWRCVSTELELTKRLSRENAARASGVEATLQENATAFEQTKKANESLIKKNHAQEEQNHTLQAQFNALRERFEELQSVARNGEGKEADCTTQTVLRKQADEIARLTAIVQTKETQITALDAQVVTLRRERQDIQDIRAEQDDTIAKLRASLANRARK
ncbi:MAG: hypothetical protein LBT03_01295 [Holosporales bacterium]|nr:hypothetical protein [Holosporales bacterium]